MFQAEVQLSILRKHVKCSAIFTNSTTWFVQLHKNQGLSRIFQGQITFFKDYDLLNK